MIEILKQIILEYQDFVTNINLIKRPLQIDPSANYIFVGLRRVGKTYALYQIIQDLIGSSLDRKQILFINFEDERLIGLKSSDFNLILEAYYQIYPDSKPVLFFDEIQVTEGWEKFVRRLADQKYRIFVTGSNAKLFSSEIATVLGGRFIIRQIYPLSFKEFLSFKKITYSSADIYKTSIRSVLQNAFEEYLEFGGLPEMVFFKHKREYLTNIYQKLFYGDVIDRYNIRNSFALKLLIKKIAEATCNPISFSRLEHILKSAGIKISKATIAQYIDFLSEAFLIIGIRNYFSSFTDRETVKKYYFSDTGILNLFLINAKPKLLQTLVFNYLSRKHEEIFYLRNSFEADFITNGTAIQVTLNLDDQTLNREIKGLIKAKQKSLATELLLITLYEEKEIEVSGTKIRVLPAWKWLIQ